MRWGTAVPVSAAAVAVAAALALPAGAATSPDGAPASGPATSAVQFREESREPLPQPRARRARWMGPALTSLPANNPYTCRELPQGYFPIPSGASSCTWIGIGTLAGNGLDGYLIPKGGGVVRRVQIKVGPVTGRMQLVVVRAMRKDNELNGACCFYRARSKVFVPKPNSITTIRVRFPMEHALNPSSKIWNFDSLGLSVLDADVPFPALATGSSGGPRDPGVAAFYPHISGGREIRVDGRGLSGFQVLMRAQYVPN